MDNSLYKVNVNTTNGSIEKELFGDDVFNEHQNSIYIRNREALSINIFRNMINQTPNKQFDGFKIQNSSTTITYTDCANFANSIKLVSYIASNYNSGYTSSNDMLKNSLLPWQIHYYSANAQPIPSGCNKINLILVGGGGGGGGNTKSGNANKAGGGGGSAGGIVYYTGYHVSGFNSYTITIGAGGTGGPSEGVNGSPGGRSELKLANVNYIYVSGGTGGPSGANSQNNAYIGAPLGFTLHNESIIHQNNEYQTRIESNTVDTGAGEPVQTVGNNQYGGAGGRIQLFDDTNNSAFSPAMFIASGGNSVNNLPAENANDNGIGFGGGGGGAGGSNKNGNSRSGGRGGDGVAVVFFRYD
jgi:hypothetical protein